MKAGFPVGIRTRLTLVFLLVNGLLLALLGVGVYLFLQKNLHTNLDSFLRAEGQTLEESLEAFLTAELHDSSKHLTSAEVRAVMGSSDFSLMAQESFQPRKDYPNPFPLTKALFDLEGNLLFSSHTLSSESPPDTAALVSIRRGQTLFQDTVTTAEGAVIPVRNLSLPLEFRGVAYAVIQVSSRLDALEDSLDNTRNLFLFGFPVFLLITALAVSLLLQGAFRPVRGMIHTLRSITDKNLAQRVSVSQSRDEIRELALTFNSLLERLDQAFRFQTVLFQDLSHQLKTPLAVLRGTLETALVKIRSAAEYEEILTSNLEEVDRISRLIESLLMLARLDSKTLVVNRSPLELRAFVRELFDDFSLLLDQKGLVLAWRDEGELWVEADPVRMRQAVINLLDNAVKYSPPGGTITLDFSRRGRDAFFAMENQGPPIPEDHLEAIFERFHRADGGEGGFGLGLAIARSIVRLFDGNLTARNLGTVRGVVFEMVFPG